jgi:anthranilate/para-aminobenzoate synthase component I
LGLPRDEREAPHLIEPIWWRFGAVVCIGERVSVVGDDAASVDDVSRQLLQAPERGSAGVCLRSLPGEAPREHAERVQAALDLISAGHIYQVNLARRLELHVEGHPLDILRSLCRDTRPSYAAAFRFDDMSVISTSPELLLEQRADGRLLTSPIKGTRPRGTDSANDARWFRELSSDPKEQAELSMIIDVERNDLGRVSRIGSVRVQQPPVVTSRGLVWHRRANVRAELRPGVSRLELLEAMLPSGSVTGAPKVRAMEVIAKLEAQRRGLYTGGLGFLSHHGELTLAMAIRTLTVRAGSGHYFTGGGIVADSQPWREVEETSWKAQQLFGRAG